MCSNSLRTEVWSRAWRTFKRTGPNYWAQWSQDNEAQSLLARQNQRIYENFQLRSHPSQHVLLLCIRLAQDITTYHGHFSGNIREEWFPLGSGFRDGGFCLAKHVVPPNFEAKGCSLTALPARFGRLWLLSHYIIASVARTAANEEVDKVVKKMFQRLSDI